MSVELRDITFAYPGQRHPVLSNFSMSVADGESVALMAPSGVGKSTALGVAGLLLNPASGSVWLDGVRVSSRDAQRLRGSSICYVFQSINLMPRRTVLDNITLPALINGWGRARSERIATEIADALGLGEFLNRPARKLSGGQSQRVGIARALVTRPRLVIADEPTANLDHGTAVEVARLLFELDRTRTSLVVATHDPTVAGFADRIIQIGSN